MKRQPPGAKAARAKRSAAGRKRGVYRQAERLLSLYATLQRERLTVSAAAELYGVSVRQIQRDLAKLRLHYELQQDADDKWYIPRERGRERVGSRELLALDLGLQLSRFLWSPDSMRGLEGRVEVLRSELVNADATRLRGWRRRVAVIAPGQKDYAGNPELGERLERILEAMLECQSVQLSYLSHQRRQQGHPPRALLVHPLGLVFYRDGLYFIVDVVPSSPEIGGERLLLALDRIQGIERLGPAGAFEVPDDFDAVRFFRGAFGIFPQGVERQFVIRVDAAKAPWLLERRLHHSQRVEEQGDGSLLLRLHLASEVEIVDWVISMGEHAELLEPVELRAKLRERLQKAAYRYV